jgi:hypothetical protein
VRDRPEPVRRSHEREQELSKQQEAVVNELAFHGDNRIDARSRRKVTRTLNVKVEPRAAEADPNPHSLSRQDKNREA